MESLSSAQRQALITLLLTLPNMNNPAARQLLLQDLPTGLQNAVLFDPAPAIHIANIVAIASSDAWAILPDGRLALEQIIENAIFMVQGAQLSSQLQIFLDNIKAQLIAPDATRLPGNSSPGTDIEPTERLDTSKEGGSLLHVSNLPILRQAVDYFFAGNSELSPVAQSRLQVLLQGGLNRQDSGKATGDTEQVKETLLNGMVSQEAWQAHEKEIQTLVSLMAVYTRNYQLARVQYAKWGDALVPPIIVSNLEDAEGGIIDTLGKLEIALSAVYGR